MTANGLRATSVHRSRGCNPRSSSVCACACLQVPVRCKRLIASGTGTTNALLIYLLNTLNTCHHGTQCRTAWLSPSPTHSCLCTLAHASTQNTPSHRAWIQQWLSNYLNPPEQRSLVEGIILLPTLPKHTTKLGKSRTATPDLGDGGFNAWSPLKGQTWCWRVSVRYRE